jgi:2,5-diketo-D-gluconate reductase A
MTAASSLPSSTHGETIMDHILLNNGVKLPLLGFGVYQVADLAECERSVLAALATGYRLVIDIKS